MQRLYRLIVLVTVMLAVSFATTEASARVYGRFGPRPGYRATWSGYYHPHYYGARTYSEWRPYYRRGYRYGGYYHYPRAQYPGSYYWAY